MRFRLPGGGFPTKSGVEFGFVVDCPAVPGLGYLRFRGFSGSPPFGELFGTQDLLVLFDSPLHLLGLHFSDQLLGGIESIRRDGNRSGSQANEQFDEGEMDTRCLTANADCDTRPTGGLHNALNGPKDCRVQLVEDRSDLLAVPVDAENKLSQIVCTNRKTIDFASDLIDVDGSCRRFDHCPQLEAIGAAVGLTDETVLGHDGLEDANLRSIPNERDHDDEVGEFPADFLDDVKLHQGDEVIADFTVCTAKTDHGILFDDFPLLSARKIPIFVRLKVEQPVNDRLRLETNELPATESPKEALDLRNHFLDVFGTLAVLDGLPGMTQASSHEFGAQETDTTRVIGLDDLVGHLWLSEVDIHAGSGNVLPRVGEAVLVVRPPLHEDFDPTAVDGTSLTVAGHFFTITQDDFDRPVVRLGTENADDLAVLLDFVDAEFDMPPVGKSHPHNARLTELSAHNCSVAGPATPKGADTLAPLHRRHKVRRGHNSEKGVIGSHRAFFARVKDQLDPSYPNARSCRVAEEHRLGKALGVRGHKRVLLTHRRHGTSLRKEENTVGVERPFGIHRGTEALFEIADGTSYFDHLIGSQLVRVNPFFFDCLRNVGVVGTVVVGILHQAMALFTRTAQIPENREGGLVKDVHAGGFFATNDVLTKTIATLDDNLCRVGADWLHAEAHARGFGLNHDLNRNRKTHLVVLAIAGCSSIGRSRVREQGCEVQDDRTENRFVTLDIQESPLLTSEGGLRQVFGGRRRADCHTTSTDFLVRLDDLLGHVGRDNCPLNLGAKDLSAFPNLVWMPVVKPARVLLDGLDEAVVLEEVEIPLRRHGEELGNPDARLCVEYGKTLAFPAGETNDLGVLFGGGGDIAPPPTLLKLRSSFGMFFHSVHEVCQALRPDNSCLRQLRDPFKE